MCKKRVLLCCIALLLTACQIAPSSRPPPVIESQPLPPAADEPVPPAAAPLPGPEPQPNAAVDALLERAHDQQAQQQFAQAAISLERAIRIAPRDSRLYLELARVRQQQGNHAQAVQLCNKATALAKPGDLVAEACQRLVQ